MKDIYHTELAITAPFHLFWSLIGGVFDGDFHIPYRTCSLFLILAGMTPIIQGFLLWIYRIKLSIQRWFPSPVYINHIVLHMITMLFLAFLQKIRRIPYETCDFLFSKPKTTWKIIKKIFSKPCISPDSRLSLQNTIQNLQNTLCCGISVYINLKKQSLYHIKLAIKGMPLPFPLFQTAIYAALFARIPYAACKLLAASGQKNPMISIFRNAASSISPFLPSVTSRRHFTV